jgi:hypothetical protein
VDVNAEGDVAILARKDSPPTTEVYSHIQDVAGSGDEQLKIETTSSTQSTPETWYVLVVNKAPYPVAYDVVATNLLGPILTLQQVNGHLELSWQGESGHTYLVQSSTDLSHWDTEQTFNGTGGVITYNPPVSGQARFYRVVQE